MLNIVSWELQDSDRAGSYEHCDLISFNINH